MQNKKQTLANRLDKIIKNRKAVAAWRNAHPRKNKEIQMRYWRKKRGYYLVSEKRETK